MIRLTHNPNVALRPHPAVLLGALTGPARRRLLGDDYTWGDPGNMNFWYPTSTWGDDWGMNFSQGGLQSSEDLGLGPSAQPYDPSSYWSDWPTISVDAPDYGDPMDIFGNVDQGTLFNPETIDTTPLQELQPAEDPWVNPFDIFTGLDPATLFPADAAPDQFNPPSEVSADPSDPNSPLFNPLDIFNWLKPTTLFNPATIDPTPLHPLHPVRTGTNPSAPGGGTGGGASSGGGGSQPQQAKPQPTLQVAVVPPNPQVGQPFALAWNSNNAQSVLVQGIPSAPSGQKQFTASAPQSFILIAIGAGGQVMQTAHVDPITHTSSVSAPTTKPASASPFASLESWLSEKTLYSKMPNGEVLALGAGAVLVVGALVSSRSGGKR